MNKTLLIFGILLGSFITLFLVIYYNNRYNYEYFFNETDKNNSDSTNNPISLENIMKDENDNNSEEIKRKELERKELERKELERKKKEIELERKKKEIENEEKEKYRRPRICCHAMTPECQACKEGISVEEYLKRKKKKEEEYVYVAPPGRWREEKLKKNVDKTLSLDDSNDAGVAINECYSLFEVNDVNDSATYNDYPLKENILMQISTEKESNIDNASNKWYDNYNYDFKSSNHDNNKFWFVSSNNIQKITNNKFAIGALLKDIQLTGPSSMQFANNTNTLSLAKFNVILTTKINNMDQGERYCLFKMALQKEVDHTADTNETISNGGHIAVILTKIDCNNIALNLYFADKEFYWTNIPINILKKNIIISLSYLHNDGLMILIDNLHKRFSFDALHEYKFGSTPLIINENGKLDMILYNFTYYNTVLNNVDINKFVNINNHLLNNKHKINDDYLEDIKNFNFEVENKNSLIGTLKNELTNCQNKVTV